MTASWAAFLAVVAASISALTPDFDATVKAVSADVSVAFLVAKVV